MYRPTVTTVGYHGCRCMYLLSRMTIFSIASSFFYTQKRSDSPCKYNKLLMMQYQMQNIVNSFINYKGTNVGWMYLFSLVLNTVLIWTKVIYPHTKLFHLHIDCFLHLLLSSFLWLVLFHIWTTSNTVKMLACTIEHERMCIEMKVYTTLPFKTWFYKEPVVAGQWVGWYPENE